MMRPFISNVTLRILAAILAAGVFFIAVSFLMYGAAIGLETVFVNKPWLGWVITGAFFLLGSTLFFKIYFSKIKKVPFNGMNITEWARKYPYQSTGVAAVAGFIIAGREMSNIMNIFRTVFLPLLIEHFQTKQELEELGKTVKEATR